MGLSSFETKSINTTAIYGTSFKFMIQPFNKHGDGPNSTVIYAGFYDQANQNDNQNSSIFATIGAVFVGALNTVLSLCS